jgi:hypothetical protein
VLVVVVVAGAVVVVCSLVVVLVCANANGAITAQVNPIIILFMVLPFSLLSLFRLSSRGKYSNREAPPQRLSWLAAASTQSINGNGAQRRV